MFQNCNWIPEGTLLDIEDEAPQFFTWACHYDGSQPFFAPSGYYLMEYVDRGSAFSLFKLDKNGEIHGYCSRWSPKFQWLHQVWYDHGKAVEWKMYDLKWAEDGKTVLIDQEVKTDKHYHQFYDNVY